MVSEEGLKEEIQGISRRFRQRRRSEGCEGKRSSSKEEVKKRATENHLAALRLGHQAEPLFGHATKSQRAGKSLREKTLRASCVVLIGACPWMGLACVGGRAKIVEVEIEVARVIGTSTGQAGVES
eukprot:s3443_g8.t1